MSDKKNIEGFGTVKGSIHSTQAKTLYAYSTLASDQYYRLYGKPIEYRGGKKPGPLLAEVRIAGKAGVMNKTNMITPKGVVTPISAEEAEVLCEISCAKIHMENKYLVIEEKGSTDQKKVDEFASSNLERNDPSAPLSETEVKAATGEKISVSTGKDIPGEI